MHTECTVGTYVINLQFDGANLFSEGVAAVEVGNRWGFIDKQGQYVINSQFNGPGAGSFSEGLAAVKVGGKWGFIGKSGVYLDVQARPGAVTDASAQYNLGNQYYNGQGVPQDYVEARKWYLKAAEQGHAKAQSNLGILYYNGQGVPQDYKLAYAWFNVAAAQGNESAKNNRDLASAKLDPASLAEAQKLSEQYHKSYVEPFQ